MGQHFAALADNLWEYPNKFDSLQNTTISSLRIPAMSFGQATPDDVVGKVLRRAEVAKVLAAQFLTSSAKQGFD